MHQCLKLEAECLMFPTISQLRRETTQTDLSSLNQFIDDMDRMVTVVELAHHLGNTLWTDAVIWSANKRGCKCAHTWTFV